ncbi:MAG: SGNH/GDSL hydrolase family protein [Balneolaceae bacterium]
MKSFLLRKCRIAAVFILPYLFLTISLHAQNGTEENSQEIMEEYDWPNLNRFRDANEKLLPPAADEKRVVFMGNSITEGWLQNYPEFFEEKPYVNRGIGGQTTPQMLIRFRADVINLEPAAVVILAGVNDIAGNTGPSTLKMIEDNLFSMAELARVNGIRVILASILPAYDFPWRPGLEPAGKIVTLNNRIRSFAEKNNMTYLDFFSAMADDRNGMKPEYSEDEVHPNREAYKVMSVLAEEAIEKALSVD